MENITKTKDIDKNSLNIIDIQEILNKLESLNKKNVIFNYIKLDEKLTNFPIYIFQTKLKTDFLFSTYTIFLIYKLDEDFKLNKILSRNEKFNDLKNLFNKNLNFFPKDNKIKYFFHSEKVKKKDLLERIENNQISSLSWIKKKIDNLYQNIIFLKDLQISYVSYASTSKFLNFNKLIKMKVKKNNIYAFLENSDNFIIKTNILKFSQDFIEKKIEEIFVDNQIKKNIFVNYSQKYVSETLGYDDNMIPED